VDIVLDTSGTRAADRLAMKKLGVPQVILMENAGRSVAEVTVETIGGARGKSVTIVCGKGKNGGDGLVAARHLLAAGASVHVILLSPRSKLGGETLRQYTILRRVALLKGSRDRLSMAASIPRGPVAPREPPSAVIDAIFGTGFHGKLAGPAKRAIDWMNSAGCPVISVDVPSGLNSDDGSVGNTSVRADTCVTMGTLKTGLLIGEGPERCGKIRVVDLGVDMKTLATARDPVFRIGEEDLGECFRRRARDSHKHSVGKVLILAGSVGLTGAAAMAAVAAMRSGAGAVVLGVPRSIYPVLSKKLTEVMVKPLSESPEATLCPDSISDVKTELAWADVILTGPGLGMGSGAHDFIEKLLKLRNKSILLDADGLNHLAGDSSLQGRLKHNTCILTPHTGEFSRLSGYSYDEIEKGRVVLTRKYARKYGVFIVLKGSPSITADPAGRVFINSTGNPGMATAGMGDVLAGIISAMWAESGKPLESTYGGVFVHGHAGDLVRETLGIRSLLAGDVLSQLPKVIKSYDFNG